MLIITKIAPHYSCMLDSRRTDEVFAICQLKEISILLERDLVFWLYDILKRYSYGGQNNQNS